MAIAPISRLGRACAFPLGVVAVALLLMPLVFHAFYTSFQDYDDEGYLLMSLRDYARGGILYDEVYSQYGPAYFQLVTPVFRAANLGFTHTHGRALAFALVITTAVVCAVAIWRLSGSRLAALAGEVLVVQVLLVSRNEPLHPGAVLAVLLAGLVLAASFLDGARWRPAAGAVGILLAAMLLMKINVGLFAVLGVIGALATVNVPGSLGPRLRLVALTAVAALPVALMGTHAGEPTVRAYIAVALASVLGVIVVAVGGAPRPSACAGRLTVLAVSGGLALAAVVGWEWARGTGPRGLLEGILVGPLRHPGAFFLAPDLGTGAFVAAATGLAGALGFAWARRRGWTEHFPGAAAVGSLQLVGGLVLWLGVADRLPMSPLALTPPLLWLALAGARPESGCARHRGRPERGSAAPRIPRSGRLFRSGCRDRRAGPGGRRWSAPPAAIVLDVLLPGHGRLGGLAPPQGRQRTQEIPVIIVTVVEEREVGLALGAADYLVKPIHRAALLSCIARYVKAAPRGGTGKRVLVVDDEAATLVVDACRARARGLRGRDRAGRSRGARMGPATASSSISWSATWSCPRSTGSR